jgi:hypothetical protein
MFPIWIYLTVAALIAATAFAIGHFTSGSGVPFVVCASAVWAAYSERRRRSRSP